MRRFLMLGVALMMQPAAAADLVLTGGRILTMDPGQPEVSAIAITGNKIVALGTLEELKGEITPNTAVLDLKGALILPGFQDAHIHLIWSGTELEDISLWEAATLDDLAAVISAGAAASSEPWVRGTGWDLSAFPDQTLTAGFLDTLVADRPAYFAAADGHSAWVNTKALAEAGITAATPDPVGGRIERDASGAPLGILRENAVALVADKMPAYSDHQVDTGLAKAMAEANSYGITAIIDPKVEDWMLAGYLRAEAAKTLTLRVKGAVEVTLADQVAAVAETAKTVNSDLLAINAVKIFADGVIEAKTAAMLAPYVDDTSAGDLMVSEAEMAAIVTKAEALGLQVHIHAIGDRAVRVGLDAIAASRKANGPLGLLPQLAHLEVIDAADIPRFAELGAVANFQGLWAYPDSYITDLTEPVIGPARSEFLYPIGAVQAAGGMIVGGSDWSVSSMNPLEAIQVAVTRQEPGVPDGRVLTPQHRVGVMDMLAAYTINAAKAGQRDATTGSLSVGKLADIVVLDRDITALAPTEISSAKVLLTLQDGRVVYDAANLPD